MEKLKSIALLLFALILSTGAFSQAKKPTIMVVPSDNWRFKNNFMNTYDNMGSTINSMQPSPAAAVDWLEKRWKTEFEHAELALGRAEKLLDEDLAAISEWRNSHGL